MILINIDFSLFYFSSYSNTIHRFHHKHNIPLEEARLCRKGSVPFSEPPSMFTTTIFSKLEIYYTKQLLLLSSKHHTPDGIKDLLRHSSGEICHSARRSSPAASASDGTSTDYNQYHGQQQVIDQATMTNNNNNLNTIRMKGGFKTRLNCMKDSSISSQSHSGILIFAEKHIIEFHAVE